MQVLKYVVIGFAALALALFGFGWLFQSAMETAVEAGQARYVPVQAQIVSVEPLCKVASDWDRTMNDSSLRPRRRSPAIDCEAAREAVAGAGPGSDARAISVNHVVYSYVSPVDGRRHQGRFDVERWWGEGGTLPISQDGDIVRYWWVDPGDPRPGPDAFDPSDPRPGTRLTVDAHRERAEISRWHQPNPFE